MSNDTTPHGLSTKGGLKILMQNKLVWTLCFVIALAGSTPARAETWQTRVFKEHGFSIDFSGDVFDKPVEVTAGRGTQYIQDGGSFAYFVTASLFENDFDFDSGVARGMSVLSCTVTDSDISPASSADRSREIHGSNCSGGVRAGVAYFLVGKRFYQVMYLIPADGDPTNAEHFLHSFKLIP